MSGCLLQATVLADLTSKISILEDAKKMTEEDAMEWKAKVRPHLLCFIVTFSFDSTHYFTLPGVLTMSVINKSDIIPVQSRPLPHDSPTFLCVWGGG